MQPLFTTDLRKNRSNSRAQNEELTAYQGILRAIKRDIKKIHKTASNDDMNPSVEVLASRVEVPVDLEAIREQEERDQAILEAHEQAQLSGEIYVFYIPAYVLKI